MTLVDANLLLHAYNPRSTDHQRARDWLERALGDTELIRLSGNPTRFNFLSLVVPDPTRRRRRLPGTKWTRVRFRSPVVTASTRPVFQEG